MDESQEDHLDSQNLAQETPVEDVFIAPSIHKDRILSGESYTHHSAVPKAIVDDMATECVLGVDEAGRGPVLGPMVYAVYYLPTALQHSLLAETHHFDDSKALTPEVRSALMTRICSPNSDLFASSGWATRTMSAQDISSAQLRPSMTYNLNAQAHDATIALIQGVLDRGVNVREIFVDTVGPPASYQAKLQKLFPAQQVTVAKKADSLFPCVSAASVCAKVTRDAALEVLYTSYVEPDADSDAAEGPGGGGGVPGWGSGYPSDARCSNWLRANMHPLFGWGNECRFSWGTAKEMLESSTAPCRVEWPDGGDEGMEGMKLTGFFLGEGEEKGEELRDWFGRRATEQVF